MINAIDNGILTTDLDADGFSIINIGGITPAPPNLVANDDPRLSDARAPLDGSVTDVSVYSDALIDQSKLNLNGTIPQNWIGVAGDQAAAASLAEYTANKGIPGGYAALDNTGRVSVLQLPPDFGTGTITSVGLTLPAELSASAPVTTTGTITVAWSNIPDGSWFGNNSGASAVPSFHTSPIPASLVPDLPASKITTGVIDPARLPPAVGVGASHAPGAVPDPGNAGNPADYLARDMTYKPLPTIGPTYQPVVADPVITVTGVGASSTKVNVTCPTVLASLFYKLSVSAPTTYTPAPSSISIPTGETISVYAAKAGYTNSNIVTYLAT